MSDVAHESLDQVEGLKKSGRGIGNLVFLAVLVATPIVLWVIAQPSPSDSELLSRYRGNTAALHDFASRGVETLEPGRYGISDLPEADAAILGSLGAESLLIHPERFTLEFRTDTGAPFVRLDEPTKSLVWAESPAALDPESVLVDTELLEEVGPEARLVCRNIDTAWFICLDGR